MHCGRETCASITTASQGIRLVNKEYTAMPYKQGFRGIVGKLYVHHANQWHRVCDADFSKDLAKLACRTLGLTGGERGLAE